MEYEIERKIYYLEDYESKEKMEVNIKEYMKILKEKYPNAIVTKEFCSNNGILIRASMINLNKKNKAQMEKETELELEKGDGRIKERGINGVGENVERNFKTRDGCQKEHEGGSERERGG